jgi:hypothetical protein
MRCDPIRGTRILVADVSQAECATGGKISHQRANISPRCPEIAGYRIMLFLEGSMQIAVDKIG